ncbi:MAG: FAD-dependent oxidoreductase, partial [Clostridia bacterium]|nr:FAD-dependent oxidoreductase [Clostridia bacterium]
LMKTLKTKVMILGAGAGGFGAAYELSKSKIPFVTADKNPSFGGTAVFGGVSCFEPGVSLDGVHKILAEILIKNGGGEVQRSVPPEELYGRVVAAGKKADPPYRWGLSVKSGAPYDQTLKRCRQFRSGYGECYRFMTDENELKKAMESLIGKEYCTALFNSEYISCEKSGRKVLSVTVRQSGEDIKIFADHFLDCTGSIVLARDAGCEYALGDDSGDIAGLNGVSVVFRASKRPDAVGVKKEDLPEDGTWVSETMKKCVSCINVYPNGDLNVNMLPTMSGGEWFSLGDKAAAAARSRVFSYWEYMRERYGLGEYKIVRIFNPGIREDYRLSGRKVLGIEDIAKPFDPDGDHIAVADHALDLHGVKGAVSGELEHPYGIPFDCARPKEFDNLFVACRGASFTHTAASSARLTRTMISMGENVAKRIAGTLSV